MEVSCLSKKHPEKEEKAVALEPEIVEEDLVGEEPANQEVEAQEEKSEEILRLEQEKEALHEHYLRLRADLENIRRRAKEEQAESRNKATEEIVLQFLPVLDNLERAVNAPGENESWRKGVEMVLRQFQSVMDNLGVKAIPAVGEIFNPQYHDAVMQEPADVAENTILMEFQRGYLLGDKVIRPSMVKVARPLA